MKIDAHIHFDTLRVYDRQMSDLRRQGADQFCILVIDRQPGSREFKQAQGVWMKWKNPGAAFLFGGIDWTTGTPHGAPEVDLVDQTERMKALGFDGLKLLCGKPDVRRATGHALDGEILRPLLEWLEDTGFPVLWHVGDPPEFWSETEVPRWARARGWWYDDAHPSKEQIDDEMARVLAHHPRLNLTLPHFFFLADRLDEASRLLERCPNLHLDLAPGVEWMHHLTANRKAGQEFFLRHADRIIYGTDMGMMENATHPDRGLAMQRFLETDERFPVPEDIFMHPSDEPNLHGLKLPDDVLRQVYARNFQRKMGALEPAQLRIDNVVKYLGELRAHAGPGGEVADILSQITGSTPSSPDADT